MGGVIAGVIGFAIVLATNQLHPTPYNNFVLLAQAFLHGHAWIDWPGPYIDALPYNNNYYVIEAPMPAILLLPAVAIWQDHTNQEVLAAILAGVSCGATWELARRLGTPVFGRVMLCGFLMLGTDLMWCATFGDVWFIAHVSSVAFTMLALLELTGSRPRGWLVAIFAACAVESRFTLVLALPFYAAMLYFDRIVPLPLPQRSVKPELEAVRAPALGGPLPLLRLDPVTIDGEDLSPLSSAHGPEASSRASHDVLTQAVADAPAASGGPAPSGAARADAARADAGPAPTRRQKLRSIASFAAVLVPFVALWVAYNYARWGLPYDIGYTAWYHQDSAGRPDGSPFRLEYLPMQIHSFFFEFPQRLESWPYFNAGFGGMALTYTSPALVFALAARGPWRTIGAMWLLTLVCAVPNFLYYVNGYAQFGMRHALDFEPFLIVLMALAFRTPLVTALAAIPVLYSMFVGGWGIWYWKTFYRQH